MDSHIFAVIVGGIRTLAGVVVGHRLNETSARKRQKELEKQEAEALRKLLRGEIDTNVKRLSQFFDKVSDPNTLPSDIRRSSDGRRLLHAARRVCELDYPKWQREVWASQLTSLTLVRTLAEDEREEVNDFYYRLSNIDSIPTKLMSIRQTGSEGQWMTQAGELFHKWDKDVTELLGKGRELVRKLSPQQ